MIHAFPPDRSNQQESHPRLQLGLVIVKRRARSSECVEVSSSDGFSRNAEAAPSPQLKDRREIPDRFKWDLTHIFADWADWQSAYDELETKIGAYAALQGTLAHGPDRLLADDEVVDEIGQLTYKVWYSRR